MMSFMSGNYDTRAFLVYKILSQNKGASLSYKDIETKH